MDVAPAGDGGRVPEPFGGLPHRLHDGALGRTTVGLERPQRPVREHRARPGAEVLGREVVPADLAEVGVDVLGADVADLAGVVDVLEQVLTGKVLAARDDPAQPPVRHLDTVPLSGLADEAEPQRRAIDLRVAIAERGQAERLVEPGVLLVADPDERDLQQPDHGGQHLLAGQTRAARDPRRPARGSPGSAAAKASIRSNFADSRASRNRG